MPHHRHHDLRKPLLATLAALAELAALLIALLDAELDETSSLAPDINDATHILRDVPPPG